MGISNPAIGSLARATWVRRSDAGELDGPAPRSAMAREAASDEAGFVIAPVIASLLLAVVEPRTALIGLAVLGLGVHLGFVRAVPLHVPAVSALGQGVKEVTRRAVFDPAAGRRPVLLTAAALLIVTGVGVIFGSTQATVNSLFAALDVPTLVGVVYGLVGVGSIVGGIAWAQTLDHRRGVWIVLAGGTALVIASIAAVGTPSMGIAWTGALCAFIGLWLSPVLAEAYSQGRQAVTTGFQVTLMTVLASGTSVGVGVGAPLASSLSATYGPRTGFLGLGIAGAAFLIGGGYILLRHGRNASRP